MRTSDLNKAFKGINDSRSRAILERVAASIRMEPGRKTYKHPQQRKIARIKRILEADSDS